MSERRSPIARRRRDSRTTAKAGPASPAAGGSQRRRHLHDPSNQLVCFTIPSDFVAGRKVQKKILDTAVARGFQGQCLFAIKLAVEEALINAIKHGNRLDRDKKVHIQAKVTPRQAEIVIEDEGEGFDRRCVPDPTVGENLEKCSGRGILLMEAYMNRVRWSHGGRRVRLVKKNENAGEPDGDSCCREA